MQPIETSPEKELALFKERMMMALKATKVCVFEVDLVQQLYTYFENSEDIFGVTGDVILRDVQPFSKLSAEEYRIAVSNYFAHPDDETVIAEAFCKVLSGKSTTYEARMRAGGSDYTWCKIDVTPVFHNDQPVKMIGVITNISDLKRENDILREKASLDLFTGLYNKQSAKMMIEKSLSLPKDKSHALVLLDINGFKAYNDTFGHYKGDRAIHALADIMKATFRSSDIMGRFGGDEFIVLITDLAPDFSDTVWLREKLQPLLKFQSEEHTITASIGVAVYPQDGLTFEELFKRADKALYHSKEGKEAISFFSQLA